MNGFVAYMEGGFVGTNNLVGFDESTVKLIGANAANYSLEEIEGTCEITTADQHLTAAEYYIGSGTVIKLNESYEGLVKGTVFSGFYDDKGVKLDYDEDTYEYKVESRDDFTISATYDALNLNGEGEPEFSSGTVTGPHFQINPLDDPKSVRFSSADLSMGTVNVSTVFPIFKGDYAGFRIDKTENNKISYYDGDEGAE